jgi:DNA polymerase V
MLDKENKIVFIKPNFNDATALPYITEGIKAGFPSPAADFDESEISLDNIVIKNKEATFYAKANGDSMTGAGIDSGDILVIDRSLEPSNGKIAVCFIDGEFTVKRIVLKDNTLFLKAENESYPPIEIQSESNFLIWGIVSYVIKKI